MVDYSINGDFNLHFDESRSFVEVSGLQEFQDDLVVKIYDKFGDILEGAVQDDNLSEKLVLEITRIAEDFEVNDSINNIDVSREVTGPETIHVSIFYNTGDTFQETL